MPPTKEGKPEVPTLRQEPGKLIERTWTTRGADSRKIRHTALGYDLTFTLRTEGRPSQILFRALDDEKDVRNVLSLERAAVVARRSP